MQRELKHKLKSDLLEHALVSAIFFRTQYLCLLFIYFYVTSNVNLVKIFKINYFVHQNLCGVAAAYLEIIEITCLTSLKQICYDQPGIDFVLLT